MARIIFTVVILLFAPIASAWAADEMTRLDVSAAKALYDKGVVFIDARRSSSYQRSHIPGAFNLSLSRGKLTEASLSKLVAKDKPVVFYCNCPQSCNISPRAAKVASKMGYKEVYFLKAAIGGWTEAGFAIEKSK